MAAKRALPAVDYQQLDSFSSVVLYDMANRKRRKMYRNKYTVKRIIHRRKAGNVSAESFLVESFSVGLVQVLKIS